MKSLIFLLTCFWTFCLFAADYNRFQEAPEVASTEGLPSSIVNGSVCIISGEYVDLAVDFVIPGPEPLVIARHYGSYSLKG